MHAPANIRRTREQRAATTNKIKDFRPAKRHSPLAYFVVDKFKPQASFVCKSRAGDSLQSQNLCKFAEKKNEIIAYTWGQAGKKS